MNDLEKQVLRFIGENTDSPDVFDSTGIVHIRDSINHGTQQFCMATGGYKRRYFLPLRENCQFYRISSTDDHFGYIVNAWDRNRHVRLSQTDLIRISHENPWWMKDTGYPDQYMHIGYDYIGVYRKPSASGIVLELDCVMIPKPYTTDTDPVKMRDAFEQAVVQFAVSEFFASRGDANRAGEWFKKALDTTGLKALHPDSKEQKYQFGGFQRNARPNQVP
uniref:Uncharacterized protein n=1 Tax=viral metagenome TaxID=1070528 RepID=A0A6M3IJT6_9ZZZZ